MGVLPQDNRDADRGRGRYIIKQVMYYAVYDITENVTRDSVIHVLKDTGMVRIQKSVFCGMLSGQQKKDLIEKVKMTISQDDDSFYLIMSCNQCFGRITTLGKDFDMEYVSDRKPSIVL